MTRISVYKPIEKYEDSDLTITTVAGYYGTIANWLSAESSTFDETDSGGAPAMKFCNAVETFDQVLFD